MSVEIQLCNLGKSYGKLVRTFVPLMHLVAARLEGVWAWKFGYAIWASLTASSYEPSCR